MTVLENVEATTFVATALTHVPARSLTRLTVRLLTTVFGTELTLLSMVVMNVPRFSTVFTTGEIRGQVV